jgi:membrane protein DedA with SNARE-associated domain
VGGASHRGGVNESRTAAVGADPVEPGAAECPPVPPRTPWYRWVPWTGRPTRVDLVLIGALGATLVFEMVLRPATPFLIASRPVLLEFLSGDLSAIGAAAAFARIGEVPLWLVVLAGAIGALKLDWLTWWIGRRWGRGVIEMLTPSARVRDAVLRVAEQNTRILRAAVVLAFLPGVPGALVFAAAGRSGMRLATFLLLDLLGVLMMTTIVAGLGYGLGQQAVDLVLWIDEYASVISVTLLVAALALPLLRRWLRTWSLRRRA